VRGEFVCQVFLTLWEFLAVIGAVGGDEGGGQALFGTDCRLLMSEDTRLYLSVFFLLKW
jgi:hypothetical protein